jgi:thiol-disulfide isomerase/thioredoxin
VKQVTSRNKEVRDIEKSFAAVHAAQEVLKAKPADRDASSTVGKFLGTTKGDWEKGVAMLAAGNDEAWSAPAKKELADPASAEERLALADDWWSLAQTLPRTEKEALAVHAAGWYQQALASQLSGLAKARAEKRLTEINNMGPSVQERVTKAAEGAHGKLYTVQLQPRQKIMGSSVNYSRPMQIKLSANRPDGIRAEPKYLSETPLYGTVQLGEGPNNRIIVVIDAAEGKTPRIYVDRNNDKDLTNDGSGEWTSASGSVQHLSNVVIDVPYATGPVPYMFDFYRFTSPARDYILYYRNGWREGEVVSGGKRYKVAVLDDNSDGRFDDLANGAILIDLNQDGKLEGQSDSAEQHKLNEPFNIQGKVWEVASLSPDGTMLALRRSQKWVEMKLYLNVGCTAPTFAGKGLDERPIDLDKEAASGKYVLLDFWASWCGPCKTEFPALRRLQAQYKDHGLRIIGVNLDTERQAAKGAAKEASLDYPHLYDGQGWKNAAAALYRVHGIPQTFLLDKERKIVAKGLRGESLEQRLRELLGPGDQKAADALKAEGARDVRAP